MAATRMMASGRPALPMDLRLPGTQKLCSILAEGDLRPHWQRVFYSHARHGAEQECGGGHSQDPVTGTGQRAPALAAHLSASQAAGREPLKISTQKGGEAMRSRGYLQILAAVLSIFLANLELALAQETIKPFGRRIVGGQPTDIKQHPWQVALAIGDGFCGGSIIAQRWILSAAHCFRPLPKLSEVRAKADATDYTHGGIWTEIEKIVVHESYNPDTQEFDLALVKLKAPTAGRVIPLASGELKLPNGQPLEVTGWGVTAEGATSPVKALLEANVPYVDSADCNAATAYNGRIKPGMICAGYREGGIDSCQGDSGGPLVWRTPDGPILVGVVSFGEGCARKLRYGIYTRVSAYRDWIDRTLASDRQ